MRRPLRHALTVLREAGLEGGSRSKQRHSTTASLARAAPSTSPVAGAGG
jgi:hypothetical protein